MLSSLGDFEEFKKVMLAYKSGELTESGAIHVSQKGVNMQMDVEGFMDKMESLNHDANTEEGWAELMN